MSDKVIYYKSPTPNFGDAINASLLDILDIPNLLVPTVGIGSILTEKFLEENNLKNKTFQTLGSGCRSSEEIKVQLSSNSFVRGPLTEKAIGYKVPYISDGAYLLLISRLYEKILNNTQKLHEVSIVPYFRSLPFFDWDTLETNYGIHVINPTIPRGIEFALQEISNSKMVIAEAMHGAIFSDIFRVPWIKLDFLAKSFESREVNYFKWTDWMNSLDIFEHHPIQTRSYHKLISNTKNYTLKNFYIGLNKASDEKKLTQVLASFLKNPRAQLSSDNTFVRIKSRLEEKVSAMR